jgi:hypothetical protein
MYRRVDEDAIVAPRVMMLQAGRADPDRPGRGVFAASGLTSLVSTQLIRTQAFTDAEQLLLRPGPVSR